jgi:hypothetical protein
VRHNQVRLAIAELRHLIGVPVKGSPGSQIKARTGILTGRSPGMTTSSPHRAGRWSDHLGRPADHRTRRGARHAGSGLDQVAAGAERAMTANISAPSRRPTGRSEDSSTPR